MLDLKGNNLPQRQQELNKIVIETVSKKVNFNEIRSGEEHTDVDRLFKIDVASKYKNSKYIIEQLKCGDELYISRALKCEWLYGDDFILIINPDFLHHNIFPCMSAKMKRKMLTAISIHVRNEERIISFYKYCKEIKLKELAFKFLIFTSEAYKLEYLKNGNIIDDMDVRKFFGNSFNLVEFQLRSLRDRKRYTSDKVMKFSYLYSISSEKYLDLFETFAAQDSNYVRSRFGIRLSKSIMTKHKKRVIRNPSLYIKFLDKKITAKYSSVEDAKQFAIALLPCDVHNFWSFNFYEYYSEILNKLPSNEIYAFLKQIFKGKYGNATFEMSRNFYDMNYYKLLTIEERELWALNHLEQKKEVLGVGNDYLWYQFVNFDLAFKEIKKYIYKTVDKDSRGKIVNVLVNSVRNEQHLEALIKYYYERHVNELEYNKQTFIDNLVDLHNVFKFNETCWNSFNKILHSMNDFKVSYMSRNKGLAAIYHITHNKELPEHLQSESVSNYMLLSCLKPFFKHLSEDQIKSIYDYYINLFINNIKEFDDKEYDNSENKSKIADIIDNTLNILEFFKKTKEDCPDIIMKYIKLDWDSYKNTRLFAEPSEAQKHSEASLIRLLKKDTTVLLKTLPDVINSFSSRWDYFHLNNLMKKLRIYFSNDKTKDLVQLFETILLEESLSNKRCATIAAINGIFHIANDSYKIDFMSKYAPTEPKISHDTINRNTLMIQESICRFAYYSRPPVPLAVVLQFIKGDYLKYCLPMLNSYVAHLPKPLCLQFITTILDAPVSLQKHGLRLAFKCLNADNLKELVLNIWRKTKNVSLRKILFKSVFDYIKSMDSNLQQNFYEALKIFTMNLNEDDDDEVFEYIQHRLPEPLHGDYLETAWKTIDKFPDENSKNIDRKGLVIKEMTDNMQYMNREFCRTSILDDLVEHKSFKDNVEMLNIRYTRLICKKWNFAIQYVIHYDNDSELIRSMEFVSIITNGCIQTGENNKVKFTMYTFLTTFLRKILDSSSSIFDKKPGPLPLLEYIVNLLTESMPMNEMYLLYWKYNVSILFIKANDTIVNDATVNKEDKHVHCKEIATRFVNELLVFIISLKQRNILFTSFYAKIASAIYNDSKTICRCIDIEGLSLVIINCLMDYQMYETYMLAVMLCYEVYTENDNFNYMNVIYDKVIEFGDEEVKSVMYQNFLSKSGSYF